MFHVEHVEIETNGEDFPIVFYGLRHPFMRNFEIYEELARRTYALKGS